MRGRPFIWTDEIEDAVARNVARSHSPEDGSMALAIVAMAFFLSCLVMAGLVAWAVR